MADPLLTAKGHAFFTEHDQRIATALILHAETQREILKEVYHRVPRTEALADLFFLVDAEVGDVALGLLCPGCRKPPHWCVCDGGPRDTSLNEQSETGE